VIACELIFVEQQTLKIQSIPIPKEELMKERKREYGRKTTYHTTS
jgi:hypothetical protein